MSLKSVYRNVFLLKIKLTLFQLKSVQTVGVQVLFWQLKLLSNLKQAGALMSIPNGVTDVRMTSH